MSRESNTHVGEADGERARRLLLGMLIALWVAGVLIPADSITAADGAGLPLVALTLLTAVVFSGLCLARRITAIPLGLVDWAVVALLVFVGVATLMSLPAGLRPAVIMLWQWVGLGVAFLLARQLIRSAAECRAVVAVMLVVALLQSLYGGWQLAVELPKERIIYMRTKTLSPNAPLPGLGYVSATVRDDYEARLFSPEPLGSFVLTNSLAGWLAAWLIVGVGVLAAAVRQGLSRGRIVIPAAICVLAMAACLIQTHSRTAQLAALTGFALLLATGGGVRLVRGGGWLLVGSSLLLLTALGLVAAAPWHFLAGPRLSLLYRWEYWQATAAMIRDHWLLGVGPGHFGSFYTLYMLPQARESISDPHNFLLEVLATAGIGATAALVVALGAFFVRVVAADRREDSAPGLRLAGVSASVPATQQVSWREADAAGARAVAIGAAAGTSLAFLLGFTFYPVVMTSIELPKFFIGFVLGGAMLWCLWPWVRGGQITAGLMAIGAAVLLINLLAAGGIAYPGVAGGLWLLIALGLCLVERAAAAHFIPRPAATAMFLAALALAAACQWLAVLPVMQSRIALDTAQWSYEMADNPRLSAAERQENKATGRRWLLEAVQADPRDDRAYRELAQRNLLAWLAEPSEESERENNFEKSLDLWLDLADRSAAAHKLAGDWFMQAAAEPKLAERKLELAGRAADAYRKAVARYPNCSLYHAHLAWAAHLAGQTELAQREAAEALRLDALNPHADRKLSYAKVRLADPKMADKPPADLMRQLLKD